MVLIFGDTVLLPIALAWGISMFDQSGQGRNLSFLGGVRHRVLRWVLRRGFCLSEKQSIRVGGASSMNMYEALSIREPLRISDFQVPMDGSSQF